MVKRSQQMLKRIKHVLNQTQLQRSDRTFPINGSGVCLIKHNVREAIAGLDGAIAGLKGVLRGGRGDAIAPSHYTQKQTCFNRNSGFSTGDRCKSPSNCQTTLQTGSHSK
jgi:hypothetical protein